MSCMHCGTIETFLEYFHTNSEANSDFSEYIEKIFP